MAKVRFSKDALEQEIKLDEKTLKRMPLLGTTIEDITDEEIELEIPANRPDLLSSAGFIRAFKTFEGKKAHLYRVTPSSKYSVKIDASVKQVRPHIACAVIENIKLNEATLKSMISLQEKMHATIGRNRKRLAIGMYPLDKVSFPLTYTAFKPHDITFTPLESLKSMTAEQILQKHPVGKEYALLLKNATRYPIIIDAKKNILSMPPIINSSETGQLTIHTNGIFVECSGFDKHLLLKAVAIISTALADAGGTIHAVKIHDTETYVSPQLEPTSLKIKKESIEKTLGLEFSEKELEQLLARMGHDYKNGRVRIPAWRTDILHEVDIAEDVAIAYGYDKLVPELPTIATIGEESSSSKLRTTLREILSSLGLLEMSSLHFITKEETMRTHSHAPALENPRTEYAFLRPSLTIPILRTLAENSNTEYPQNLYEVGTVFKQNIESETGVEEKEHVIVALTPGNFTKIKQVLDYLASALGKTYELKEENVPGMIAGRTGKILMNNRIIGHIGEMHPETLREWRIRMPVALFEIDITQFYNKG